MADGSGAVNGTGAFAIRPPTWALVYVGLFMLVWTGMLLWMAMPLVRRGDPTLIGFVLMLFFGCLLVWRVTGVRAVVSGESLTVRNTFRTIRFSRDAIDRVTVGKPSSSPLQFGRAIVVLDRDGGLTPVDASAAPAFTARGRERVARQAEALDNWRNGAGHRER